jgi:rhodanese-related sulfurtransferase
MSTRGVPTIDRAQLAAKLARGDRFQLVMAGSDWAYRAKHIPGSVHFARTTPQQIFASLGKDEVIVVYCSNLDCHASLNTIKDLVEHGYAHVSHYAGGLLDWEGAGLPIEGEWAGGPDSKSPV